jgi:hypothetical protein
VKRMSLAVASVLLVVACASTPAARASCLGAVVVDGAVLMGYRASDWTLPIAAAETSAVVPACNDGGPKQPDGSTTVVRFVGVPADIAVRSVDGDDVYIVAGSLTALGLHPLHRSTRRLVRRRCGRKSTLEGMAGTVGFDSIELVAGARSHFYRVDARTVLVNRPAYQPIRRGQRLSVAATRCGERLIADRITFTGPTIVPKRYSGQVNKTLGSGLTRGIIVLPLGVLGLVLAAWLAERVTRP